MLRQGFTHAFLMTFGSKEDLTAFCGHPNHVEFSSTFSTVIEKAMLLDFPVVTVKAPAWPTRSPHNEKNYVVWLCNVILYSSSSVFGRGCFRISAFPWVLPIWVIVCYILVLYWLTDCHPDFYLVYRNDLLCFSQFQKYCCMILLWLIFQYGDTNTYYD